MLESPTVLLLLPAAIVVGVLLYRSARATRATAAAFAGQAPRRSWHTARLACAVVFMLAITIVAAGPFVTYASTGSYLFVVDVSRSMQARFACSEPTFLDRARQVMLETIEAVPEGRFGIVAFDRFAFPVTQLTSDRAYLADVISHGLYVGLMLEATQTEIANALTVVADKRERLPDAFGDVSHVILISDGHVSGAFERRLQVPLARLREAGVSVSAVGIGNPEPTPITDSDDGQCVSEWIEINGERVMIPLRTDILKYVATEGAGGYFTENETGDLAALLRSTLRPAVAGTPAAEAPTRDISGLFVAIAALALLGFVYLPVRFPDKPAD